MVNIFKSIKFQGLLLSGLLLMSCDKYLDVTPKGYTLLTTVTNYDQWMNDYELYNFNQTGSLILPSDIRDFPAITTPPTTSSELAYVWAAQHTGTTATLWQSQYEAISSYNTVIQGIDEATGGTEQQKKTIKAEAMMSRAFYYFYLVNQYGKSYDSTTASTDLAVPIVVSDDVAQTTPPRSTVKEVYDFIISDLNTALPDLPLDNNKNKYRGSKAAAYSLLARTYFFARNYTKAGEYAQLALENSYGQTITDYTSFTVATEIRPLAVRPDVIFARATWGRYEPTIAHLKRFNTNDKRLRFFYSNLGNFTFPQRGLVYYAFGGQSGSTIHDNLGTSIQEMVLILAEVAARNNNLDKALDLLADLREKRIPAANYVRFESTDEEEVLNKILEERELELPFNGLRWFDMRRLNAENRMPAVIRYNGVGDEIATLEPGSVRYTFQIPQAVIEFNPGMPQNP